MVLIFREKVYDLSDYEHPGGHYLFVQHNWKEISRYLHGCHSNEAVNIGAYKHSLTAYYVLDKHYIGSLVDRQQNHSSLDRWVILDKKYDRICFSNEKWKVIEKVQASSTMTIIRFLNSKFKIKSSLRGVDWIGKHFYITDHKKKPYTFCISLSSEVKIYRDELIKLFDLKINREGSPQKVKATLELKNYTNILSFVIRKYHNSTALSKRIIESDENSRFQIEGPYVSLLHNNYKGNRA